MRRGASRREAASLVGRRLALLVAVASIWAAPAAGQDGATLYAFDEAVAGGETLRLRWPTAVAAGGADEIAVADAEGPSLAVFRDLGGGEGWVVHAAIELPAPAYSVSCGADFYLISTRRPGVLLTVAKSDYTLRELALAPGITPGAATCLPDDRLLVHDLAAGRLVVLDGAGKVLTAVAIAETVAALAPGAGGGFYAALPGAGEVRRYGANGEQLSSLKLPGVGPTPAWPVGLAVEANGEVVVVDRHGGRILVVEASGRLAGSGSRKGWEPGLLRFPASLARLPDGRVVVADQGNGRVQLFRRLEE
ncbi:MAG: hypothetical protein OES32_05525 [Acidobacteriota bacterium]|nr:hypothetical protein [Acidobacteriota bacterium]